MANIANLYKNDAKNGYLYPLPGVGQITSTDLFTLDLPGLDSVAKTIHGELEKAETISFIGATTAAAQADQERLEIVKDVIADKKAELTAEAEAEAKRVKKQRLLAALEVHEREAELAMTPEEIREELAKL